MNIGAHVSIAGGIVRAPRNAAGIGCECFQIFTRSPRGGPAREITPQTADEFRTECERFGQRAWYIHTPYYVNLASADSRIAGSSVRVVREELERGCAIGARAVMTHVGSAGDEGRGDALDRAARNLRRILDGYIGKTRLLLENAAGSGSIVGSTLDELSLLNRAVGNRCGVCLDTQHLFASGYDIRTKKACRETFDRVDQRVGLERLVVIHANDSKVPFNSRRDRHEHIGDGAIGRSGFKWLLSERRLLNTDVVAETKHDRVAEDIRALKSLRSTARRTVKTKRRPGAA